MNKKVVIAVVVAFVILLGGGYFVLSSQNSVPKQVTPTPVQEEVAPTIAPADIGLDFFPTKGNKYVKFTISNVNGIDGIEYEIAYNAEVDGNTVSQGLNGEIKKEDLQKGNVSIERILGTCSTGGKCRYDEGVTGAKLTLKITKSDGKVFQSEKSISF